MPQYDFKKEWEKTKIQLIKFSKEAAEIAKKGEDELKKFTKKSKLQIDTTAAHLKKEKLFYLIGKEYATAKKANTVSVKLKKLMGDYNKVDKEEKTLLAKMKKPK